VATTTFSDACRHDIRALRSGLDRRPACFVRDVLLFRARDPLLIGRSFALFLLGALFRPHSLAPSTDLGGVSGVEVRKGHAFGDDAGNGLGDNCLVFVLTMIRTVSAPYVYRYRRPDERHQLGGYATIHVAHIGLEALRACRVR
ncbi:unnamed protein product, partial [Ectocarpus sp. 13 AM-2016]